MTNDLETVGLFPIPVSTTYIDPISEDIIDFAKSVEYMPWHSKENYYLSISKERQVLDTFSQFKELRASVMKAVEQYWREVLCVDNYINLKIRHSWLTRHYPGEQNPAHTHTTSLFTCCVYLQTADGCGDIVFKKDTNYLNLFPSMIDLDYRTRNLINSKSYSITPKNNMIICFPSHLQHEALPNMSTTTRYALNMDFWFEGTVRKNSNGFDAEF
jgi:uncharacterized protein (TIGR02466 family)